MKQLAVPMRLFNWVGNFFRSKYYRYKFRHLNKPLPIEEKWLASAKPKIVMPSMNACKNLIIGKKKRIALQYEDLDLKKEVTSDFAIEFKKDSDPGIGFIIRSPDLLQVRGVEYKEGYGLNNALSIETSDGRKLFVRKNSVKDFKTIFPSKPHLLEGRFINLSDGIYEAIRGVYIRLIVQIDDTDITYPSGIITEKGFLKFDQENWNRQSTLLGLRMMSKKGQYVEIPINEFHFDFYTIENLRCQFIDSTSKMDIATFKKYSNSIRSAFALLSGKFYRANVFFVTSNYDDFSIIQNVFYEMEEPSWQSGYELIDLEAFSAYYERQTDEKKNELEKYHTFFPSNLFGKLCEEICNNSTIERVVSLMLSGNQNLNSLQQGAIYSVAIETLANEIYEKHHAKLQPITDKQVFKTIRSELLQVLDKHKGNISSEALNIFSTKIQMLNQQTNRNRLFKPFELYDIHLTQREQQTLEHRNDFLHGKAPHENEWEIQKLALEFHVLLACLLLKYIGYSGYVSNLPVYYTVKKMATEEGYLPEFDEEKVKSLQVIQQLIKEGKHKEVLEIIEHTQNALKALEKMQEMSDNIVKII